VVDQRKLDAVYNAVGDDAGPLEWLNLGIALIAVALAHLEPMQRAAALAQIPGCATRSADNIAGAAPTPRHKLH
jgi:hypothetical protein